MPRASTRTNVAFMLPRWWMIALLMIPRVAGAQEEEPDEPPAISDEKPVSEDHSAEVAHDAYLGGSGVVGPVSLLGTSVNLVVEPMLGAAASLMAAGRSRTGSVQRSTVSAYARTLTYIALFTGSWLLTLPFWAAVLVVIPGAAAAGVVAFTHAEPRGIQAALGTAMLLGGVGAVLLSWCWGIPWFIGRNVGVVVGDRVWDAMTTEKAAAKTSRSEVERLLTTEGSGPMHDIKAGVLLAAVAGGIWERNLGFDGIPVVGPILTAVRANRTLPERLSQARELAGLGPLPEGRARWLFAATMVRSVMLSAAQAGFVVLAGLLVTTGAALLLTSLVGALFPVLGAVVLGVAAVAALCVGVPTLLTLGASLFMNAFVPWILVAVAARG